MSYHNFTTCIFYESDYCRSFVGHVGQLFHQREVQALLGWALLCLAVPVPSMLRDMVMGALVMHAVHVMHQWLFNPGPVALEPIKLPDYSLLPILKVPAAREYQPMHAYEVRI